MHQHILDEVRLRSDVLSNRFYRNVTVFVRYITRVWSFLINKLEYMKTLLQLEAKLYLEWESLGCQIILFRHTFSYQYYHRLLLHVRLREPIPSGTCPGLSPWFIDTLIPIRIKKNTFVGTFMVYRKHLLIYFILYTFSHVIPRIMYLLWGIHS